MPTNRSIRPLRALPAALALMLAASLPLAAQSNFAFWLGGAALSHDDHDPVWGTTVGVTAKFNITPIFLFRGQFNVDRIQFEQSGLPDFNGDQTMTFVSLGTGPEIGLGGKDFNLLAHVTLHGTIRTVTRILDEDNREKVWGLTRFSLGILGGVGFEAYITDNIGVELQGQYDIYNFDTTPLDPSWRGLRATAGVQFYLGRNFVR